MSYDQREMGERERERERERIYELAYLDRTFMRADGHSFFVTARSSPTFYRYIYI